MNRDYTNYTAEELLQDDFFIQSVQYPTTETDSYWNQLVNDGKVNAREYKLAVFFLKSIRVKNHPLTTDVQSSLWDNIEITNKQLLKNKLSLFRLFMVAAASVAILTGLSVAYWYTLPKARQDIMSVANVIKPSKETSDIQLILPDRQIPISEQNSIIQYDSVGVIKVNSKAVYETDTPAEEKVNNEIQYAQLIVPNGKRSTLTLEDGSKLWINAGSRIVYPAKFNASKREIYVDGEVYLEVTHDESRPFIVKTNNMDIKVLGTSFNIMAYEKDKLHAVVLVSGSVQVNTNNNRKTLLTPNNILTFSEGQYNIKEVDVANYISWKKGLYKYESENLSVIFERLSRYYGKKIQYSKEVSALKCSGKLDMQDDLEIVLSGLCQTAQVRLIKTDDGFEIKMISEIK